MSTDALQDLKWPGPHDGITCDGCKKIGFEGVRYKCSECADFDLCPACFLLRKETDTHKKNHNMVPIEGIGKPYPLLLAFFQAKSLKIAVENQEKEMLLLKYSGTPDFVVVVRCYRQAVTVEVKGQNVPMDKMKRAAEYITRANYGLPRGRFVLDDSDGDLRFRMSFVWSGLPPKVLLVHFGVAYDTATSTYLRYMNHFDEILRGDPVVEVIKKIESK